MTDNTQKVAFQSAPTEHHIANVVSSQKGILYLNKPKYHKEEEEGTEAPLETDITVTPVDGNTPSQDVKVQPSHDWEKRYSDLQSYSAKQLKAKEDELYEQRRVLDEKQKLLEAIQAPKMPSTPKEVEEFKLKFGSLYNMIETIAMNNNLSTKKELERAIEETNKTTKQLTAEKARQKLREIHPDVDTIKSDPEFIKWFESQVGAIKSLLTSDFVEDVARGIDIYKKDTGIVKQTRTQKAEINKEASMAITTKSAIEIGKDGGKVWKASEVKRMSPSQYAKNEAEILKAYAEGRYDENN